MPTLPALDVEKNANNSPHIVILGAGASLAAFPDGDRNGIKLPLMNNLVEVLDLKPVIEKHGLKYEGENFEAFYDFLSSCENHLELLVEIEDAVEKYFSRMRLPDNATLYDYLVLSLRCKDVIATFNWDPFLAQAFQRNMQVIGYEQMPKMVFLHGNVAIGVCYECKTKGWRYNICDRCRNKFAPSKLLYPVSNKDYSSDEFLSSEWEILQHYIQHAYFITVFGYSAPVTDAEARKLMLDVWHQNTTRDLAQIDIIDIMPRDEIKINWNDFIVRENYAIQRNFFDTYLARHLKWSRKKGHLVKLHLLSPFFQIP